MALLRALLFCVLLAFVPLSLGQLDPVYGLSAKASNEYEGGWEAVNVLGAPNYLYMNCEADNAGETWSLPSKQMSALQWVKVDFPPTFADTVVIREALTPGFVTSVKLGLVGGSSVTVFDGSDPTVECPFNLEISFAVPSAEISSVTVTVNTDKDGYEAIDSIWLMPAEVNDKCADVVCEAQSQCHVVGECNSATGECSNPMATDGTVCNDGDDNTVNDQCKLGVCKGYSQDSTEIVRPVAATSSPYYKDSEWDQTPENVLDEATGVCGDNSKSAWSSTGQDGSAYLTVEFDVPIDPVSIVVSESLGSGMVESITLTMYDGKTVTVAEGQDVNGGEKCKKFQAVFEMVEGVVSARLNLDLSGNGWEEIDEVYALVPAGSVCVPVCAPKSCGGDNGCKGICGCPLGSSCDDGVCSDPENEMYSLNVNSNLAAHNTQKFYLEEKYAPKLDMILRRGQTFTLTRSVASAAHVFALNGKILKAEQSGKDVIVEIPGDFAIGEYELTVDGLPLAKVAVFFNPFSPKDVDVYMPNAEERNEYIMQTSGYLFFSGSRGPMASGWRYSQFQVAKHMLKMLSFIPGDYGNVDMSNAAMVTRALTAMGNTQANHGLLWGRWDGEYEDGRSPSTWTDSLELFEAWEENGYKPVKYGQCWVFGATLTTMLRAIGVPTRPLTNFQSAHESKPFDFIIDRTGSDSIWNFHVWVDSWVSRADLDRAADWNAFDSTPQETSEYKYQMGPASLEDLANTNWNMKYDVAFVLGETNGIEKTAQGYLYDSIGTYILTKKVGQAQCSWSATSSHCSQDLKKVYKPDSEYWKGKDDTGKRDLELISTADMIAAQGFELSLEPTSPIMGEDFAIRIKSLKGQRMNTYHLVVDMESVQYTGQSLMKLELETFPEVQGDEMMFKVPFEAYVAGLKLSSVLNFDITLYDSAKNPVYSRSANVELDPVPINLSLERTPDNVEMLRIAFVNPTPITLHNVAFDVATPAGYMEVNVGSVEPKARSVSYVQVRCGADPDDTMVIVEYAGDEVAAKIQSDIMISC